MKYIKESLYEKFKEEADPITDMKIGKEGIFRELEKLGVRTRFEGWLVPEDGIKEKKKAIENIVDIKKTITKLIEVGLKYSDIELDSSDCLRIQCVTVLNGNVVIFYCISKEDAQYIINIARKFSVWNYDHLDISTGEKRVNVKDHEWLDNLIENRKRYRNIE